MWPGRQSLVYRSTGTFEGSQVEFEDNQEKAPLDFKKITFKFSSDSRGVRIDAR